MKETCIDLVYSRREAKTQSTMGFTRLCDWPLLAPHGDSHARTCWMLMISSDTVKTKTIPAGRIICIERGHLKNGAFFVLTDCSLHPNFRRGSTQKIAKYKPHYTPCHRSFIDTWGIKKWQRCRHGGCEGTKMCHERMRWHQQHAVNQTLRCIPHKVTISAWRFFPFLLQRNKAAYLQIFLLLWPIYCF